MLNLAVCKDISNSSDIEKFKYLYIMLETMKIAHCQNQSTDMPLGPGMLVDDKH